MFNIFCVVDSSGPLILLVLYSFSYFVVINGRITITIDSSSAEEDHKSRRKGMFEIKINV